MLKPRFLLFLFALTTVGAVGFVLHSHNARTPEALLAAATHRLEEEQPDFDAALRELDVALELALAEDNRALAEEIFTKRAYTYVRRNALPSARRDFETVLNQFQPGSNHVTLQIGWIDLNLGNYNQALAAADAVLKETPWNQDAYVLRGRTLVGMAELGLEEVVAQTQAMLADAPAARAEKLAWKAATLGVGHPHRSALLSELDEVCAGHSTASIRKLLDAASVCWAQARASFVSALEYGPYISAMESLLALLQRGERWAEIVDFGLAASNLAELHTRLAAVEALVEALDQLGRPGLASAVLSKATEENLEMPPELLATWCRLLYEAEDWERLENIGRAMQQRKAPTAAELRKAASLFVGIAKLKLGKLEEAIAQFQVYTANPPANPPIEDALAHAYYGMAQANRQIGNAAEEYKALKSATSSAPKLSGEAWQRLAELQVARGEPMATVSESMVHAMGLMPSRVNELIPLWEKISEQSMAERRRSIEGGRRYLREIGTWIVPNDDNAISWEFWKLGKLYLESGQPYGTIEAARAFLGRYPDHVLGLDLRIEGELARGFSRRVVEALIERMRVVGPHPDSLAILAGIPGTKIEPEEFLVMMELDPKNTGLLRMVEELRAEGREELAIDGLRSIPSAQVQPETRLLLAELYLETNQWQKAIETLEAIPPGSKSFAAGLELAVQAASSTGKPVVLRETLQKMAAHLPTAELEPAAAVRTALCLLKEGEMPAARLLLDRLDAPGLRTGEALDTLSLCLLQSGELDAAEDTIDRAEAFLTGPESHVSRIVLLARAGRWDEIPAAVEALRASEYTPSPWVDAALLALSERVSEAATAAARAIEQGPAAPEWFLLLRAANLMLPPEDRLSQKNDPYPNQTVQFVSAGERDPRWTFLVLLGLETPTGSAWAYSDLDKLSEEAAGRLWPTWLQAKALRRMGQEDDERAALLAVAKGSPKFTWCWDRLQELELERLGSAFHPAFPNFLDRRLTALGPSDEEKAWNAVVRSQRLTRQGAVDDAISYLERTVGESIAPSPLVLITLARLQAEAGRGADAVLNFASALSGMPSDAASSQLAEFLELGTAAFDESALSETTWRALLAALRAQLPKDPLVSLAWARFERTSAKDPVKGWSLAGQEYTPFREATKWTSLDELRPGAAAAWAEFFLSENPREAEMMIREELPLSPGSPDLWRMLADSLAAQGKLDDAFDRYIALINILPEPGALRSAAEMLAQRGGNEALLARTLGLILEVERATAADPSLELLRAISFSRNGGASAEAALKLFDALWTRRDDLASNDQIRSLGIGYSVALLRRGLPGDAPHAKEVLDELAPKLRGAADADYVRSLACLAKWATPRAPEQTVDAEALDGDAEALDGDAEALDGDAEALDGEAEAVDGEAEAVEGDVLEEEAADTPAEEPADVEPAAESSEQDY